MVVVFSVTQLPKWITSFYLLYKDTQAITAKENDPVFKLLIKSISYNAPKIWSPWPPYTLFVRIMRIFVDKSHYRYELCSLMSDPISLSVDVLFKGPLGAIHLKNDRKILSILDPLCLIWPFDGKNYQ